MLYAWWLEIDVLHGTGRAVSGEEVPAASKQMIKVVLVYSVTYNFQMS